MATAESGALRRVGRYWREVESEPGREHAHVALLGLRTYDPARLHDRLEEGLSYEALERLRRVLGVPAARVSALVGIPARTLARRREAGRLRPDESDRLVRLSRLVGLAVQLFEGELEEARAWLGSPQAALGGRAPLDFATTGVGAREVERLIGRLEHGIPL